MQTSPIVRPAPHPAAPSDDRDPEASGCNVCGSTRREQLFSGPDRLMGFPGTFSFVRCGACGLIYQWPRLPWEQLKVYYHGDYTAYAQVTQDEPSPLRRMVKRIGPLKQRRYVE